LLKNGERKNVLGEGAWEGASYTVESLQERGHEKKRTHTWIKA